MYVCPLSSGQPDTVGVLEAIFDVEVPVRKPPDVVKFPEYGGTVAEIIGVSVDVREDVGDCPPLGSVVCDRPPE